MPRDEARRLVWADQLLERGDPRGELITTQCALARGDLPREASLRLRRREAELLALVPGLEGRAGDWTWSRGAIEEIRIDAETFSSARDSLFELAPFLHRLRIIGLPVDPIHAAALLEDILDDERIDGLLLGTHMDPALVVELGAEGHLERLRAVELQGFTLGMVMRIEALRNLEELSLVSLWDPFSARSTERTELRPRRLRLQSSSQQKQSVELDSLAHPDFFSRLEELELDWFTRPNVFVRASTPILQRLRRLLLPMGTAAMPISLAADFADLANLEELSISFFGSEDEIDFGALTKGDCLPKLRVLRFGIGNLTVEKVRELLRSPLGATLEVLDLRKNRWRFADDLDWDGIVLT